MQSESHWPAHSWAPPRPDAWLALLPWGRTACTLMPWAARWPIPCWASCSGLLAKQLPGPRVAAWRCWAAGLVLGRAPHLGRVRPAWLRGPSARTARGNLKLSLSKHNLSNQ